MAFKTYKEDFTAAELKIQLSRGARDLVRALEAGHDLAEQWEAYKRGKVDLDIETALSISAAEHTDIAQAFDTLANLFAIYGGDDTVNIPISNNNFSRRLREFS